MILPAKILALGQPSGIEVDWASAGMGPVPTSKPAQIPFPARPANGCHAALFMDK